ncbi:alanine--tRNA ligase [Candidatus Woesearchaeota archaeon]|nr:alanine--tRNA ligase [Candidatus Woesearchaeota archaeon]
MGDKQIKEEFRAKASKTPDKYYATSVLKEEGFSRKNCSNCKRFFWSVTEGNVCGDPACSGGFRFIDKSPAKEKLDYIQSWKKFASHFKNLGYEPIKRYPVAARWRDDTDFVQASIYDFQPYVVSGEVEPPANPLVVPQFCLRFNDIDNVGITGAHYTGFVMIGQHAFVPKDKFDQPRYFRDIHSWLRGGLGLPNEEITYHEDAWAGGGNFGPCMEYFSRGLEIGNQVYMLYEVTGNSYKELPLKVLDMGMGQERNAWFTGAAPTSYETTFPTVVKKLNGITGIKVDGKLLQKFLPYSSYLNVDEVEDIDKTWGFVSKKIGTSSSELRKQIIPLSELYSIAEHSRSLLVALTDGILPSNVGGGYNLRVILRRALSFIDAYGWKIDLAKLCELHARYLKPQFPELSENLSEVAEVLEAEKRKYNETKHRAKQIVSRLLQKNEKIADEKLIELYDSQGINPSQIAEEAAKENKKIAVPENFYALVAARHGQKEQKSASKRKTTLNLEGVPATEALYYSDYAKTRFSARVVKIIGKVIFLDKTYFFPTSGGQINDKGEIVKGPKVEDVFRQGKHIGHVLSETPDFKLNATVDCVIDFERRKQLSQHHTVTHIFNQLMRRNLGKHAWQAGTAKFVEKARLDMTHYESLTQQQLQKLEKEANEVIKKDLKVVSSFIPRTKAEQKYGFGIYQGPVVPGKELRIVEIEGFDVEACGGTHVHHTGEIEAVKIIKSGKVQDGVVRIEYSAGKAFNSITSGSSKIVNELAGILGCTVNPEWIPSRCEELFDKWKQKVKKGRGVVNPSLVSTGAYRGDVIKRASEIFRTQPEHLVRTAKRFLDELGSLE